MQHRDTRLGSGHVEQCWLAGDRRSMMPLLPTVGLHVRDMRLERSNPLNDLVLAVCNGGGDTGVTIRFTCPRTC